jgi:hypothetical protein
MPHHRANPLVPHLSTVRVTFIYALIDLMHRTTIYTRDIRFYICTPQKVLGRRSWSLIHVNYFFYTRTLLFPTSGKKSLLRMNLPSPKRFVKAVHAFAASSSVSTIISLQRARIFFVLPGREIRPNVAFFTFPCQNEKRCVHRIESYRNSNEVLEMKPKLDFYVRCTMTMKTVVSNGWYITCTWENRVY